jgi:ketosteroid isomerase-like protein
MQASPFLPTTFILIVLAVSPIEVVTDTSAQQQSETAPSAATAEVRRAVDRFFDSMAASDWETFRLTFSEDATFFAPALNPEFSPNRKSDRERARRVNGRDEIAAGFERQLQNLPRERRPQTPQDIHIQIFGDSAVVTLQWDSDRTVSRRTLVFQRQRGKWLIVHIHASAVTYSDLEA